MIEYRIPPPPRLRPLPSYAVAVALPLLALAVEHSVRGWIENVPFVLFFVVVSITASVGGWGPGILAVGISAAAGWWFLVSSEDPSKGSAALAGAFVFAPAALAVALLGALVRAGYRERERVARALSTAIRARDEFISLASHELKTPLTALTLSVHRLARTDFGGRRLDDPEVGRAVGLIGRQASRLNILANNLLDVSRLASGPLHLELREVDLAEVVRDVASRFEQELAHAGCALTLATPEALVGRWDRLRLEQVVTNLLANAVKYGAGRPIEVSVREQDGMGALSVTDRGVGIAPGDHARIFGRFERAGSGRAAEGMGVGLWLVDEIVTALGGSVGVESAPEEGARFTVLLPLRREEPLGLPLRTPAAHR